MGFKFNPFTRTFDLVGTSSGSSFNPNDKLTFHLASLEAYDKVISITYLDSGLKSQRISQISYSSILYPDATLVKNIFWLDAGTMNQRIDKEEYVGGVLAPDSVRKTYNYVSSDIRYRQTGYELELF